MTLFALMFGAPELLWGLGAAAAPIIIHLLNRRRFKTVDWAAMKWLLEAARKNSRRIQLEQWLLLAVRTLIVLLIVLAMAKPAIEALSPIFATDTQVTHYVLVFDNSLSMQYAGANQSHWEKAKSVAHSVLDDAQQGDQCSVVVIGNPPTVLVGEASPNLSEIGKEIDSLKPQHGVGKIEPAMTKVLDVLRRSRAARRQVVLITDMQKTNWTASGENSDAASLLSRWMEVRKLAEVAIVDVATSDSPNMAVTEIEQVDPLIVRGRPALFRGKIANFSHQAQDGLKVEFVVNGQVEATQQLSIPAGESKSVSFGYQFPEIKDHLVEIRVPQDSLKQDDSRRIVAHVRDYLSVLLIDGQPSGEMFLSEADYLRFALAPGDDTSASFLRPVVRPESELLTSRLDEFDAVILCNVSQFTSGEAAVLDDYAKRGGGLLFFLGTQTNLQAYNQVLYQDGKGVLPGELVSIAGSGKPGDQSFVFDPLNYRHPIVRPFQASEQAGLLTTKVLRYVKMKLAEKTTARVALGYRNGDPAIVTDSRGAGTVAVITTSADLDWNTWAVSPSYLPIMNEIVQFLVMGRTRIAQSVVGEPIQTPLPRRAFDVAVSMSPPDNEPEVANVRIEEQGGGSHIAYSRTDLVGAYKAKLGPPIQEDWLFAVNGAAEESDLTRLNAADVKTLLPGIEVRLLDRWQGRSKNANLDMIRRGELSRPPLYLALLLVLIETYLAWRFGQRR